MGRDKRRRVSKKEEAERIKREERLLEQVKTYKRATRIPCPPPGHYHDTEDKNSKRKRTTREYLEELAKEYSEEIDELGLEDE